MKKGILLIVIGAVLGLLLFIILKGFSGPGLEPEKKTPGLDGSLGLETYEAAKAEYLDVLSRSEDLKKLSYEDFVGQLGRSVSSKSFFDSGYLYEAIQKDLLPSDKEIKDRVSYNQQVYQADEEVKDFLDGMVLNSGIRMEDYWETVAYVQEAKSLLSIHLANGYLASQGKKPIYGQSHAADATEAFSEDISAMDQEVAAYLESIKKDG